tara:strand:+ start:1183 stop:1767 length:585 start_codon:yes stop_codon:yes gene_type:complete
MKKQYYRFLKVMLAIYAFVFILGEGLVLLDKNDIQGLSSSFSLENKIVPSSILFNVEDLEEQPFVGHKDNKWPPVTIVNWWGSWCSICMEEFPTFRKWGMLWSQCEEQTPGSCPVLIGIAFDDSLEDVQKTIEKFGLVHENWIDMEGRALVDWGVGGAPETYFIDSSGIVRKKVVGLITEEELLDTIDWIMKND